MHTLILNLTIPLLLLPILWMIVQILVLDPYLIWRMPCMYNINHTRLCFAPNRNWSRSDWRFETQSVECDKFVLIIAFTFKWPSIALLSWSFLIQKSIRTEFCCWSNWLLLRLSLKLLILFPVFLVSCNRL